MFAYVGVCMYMCVYMCIYCGICVCMYVSEGELASLLPCDCGRAVHRSRGKMYTYMCVYVCICMYMYIYVCMYVCMYM